MKIFLLLFFLSAQVFASEWKASGGAQLVELYTSEGCSSCPPADKWISELKNDSGLWKTFVPLSFHVSYWDNLGWPDRFAKDSFTDRQRAYSRAWGKTSVYTPGIVIQGEEAQRRNDFHETALKFSAAWDGKKLLVSGKIPDGVKVHFAWLGLDIKSAVKRGENAGRNLEHNFVVLSTGDLGLLKSVGYEFVLPSETAEKPKALAIWLEKDGHPLSAIGNIL